MDFIQQHLLKGTNKQEIRQSKRKAGVHCTSRLLLERLFRDKMKKIIIKIIPKCNIHHLRKKKKKD